jgi:hypothetical protein
MRYSTTVILAIALLGIAVLMYAYRDQLITGEEKKPPEPAAARGKAVVEDLALDSITGATLEERGADGQLKKKMAFARKDGKWRLTEPLSAPAEESEVNRLLRPVAEGKYRQSFEPGAKGQPGLEAEGLAPPAYRLVLAAEAKGDKPARTVTVDIGRKSQIGEGLYVRVGDSKKVIVLDSGDLLDRAKEGIDTYRSKDLVTLSRDDLVRIDIETEKSKVRLDKAEGGAEDRWVLSQPMAARADGETVGNIVRSTLGLKAKDFVDAAAKDLARYGLAKPRLTVTLWKAGTPEKPKTPPEKAGEKKEEKPPAKPEPVKAVTLKFGASADMKNESVYLASDDSKSVVSVAADVFSADNKTLADLRDKHVLALDPAKATQVTVRLPPKLTDSNAEVSYELVKAEGSWKAKVAGRPDVKADSSAVEALLKELAGLKVIYFAEGEHADVAKGFKAQGSVRIQAEKESAPVGFEVGTGADVPALVKNIREDWVGRINEKGVPLLRKDWMELLDKQVFSVDPKKATRLAVQTADRKVVLEKTGTKWELKEPVKAEPRAGFEADCLGAIQDLKCTKYVAAAKDFKKYNLDPGELVVTVTQEPEKQGEKPVEKVLRLAHQEKATIVGRADPSDIVFEVPLTTFKDLVGEPLPTQVGDLPSGKDVSSLEITAASAKVKLLKVDEKWYRADAAGRPGDEVTTDAAEDIVKAASGLKAVRWAAYDAKGIAQFGLDKPAVAIKVTAGAKSGAVLISDKEVPAGVASLFDERPLRFAMAEGGDKVAIVAGKTLETLLDAAKAFEPKKAETKPGEPKPAEKK